jgi:DNA-binding GntR family transcriptional regulator
MPATGSDGSVQDLRITRSSAVDQVAEAVREMILRGELTPGTRLREVQMAESIGISRNTARDAVRVLARQGLVTRAMHRGAVVVRLTERDVVDVFRVRRAIESQAIEASVDATPDQLAGLEDAVFRLERAAKDVDWERMVEADCLFHLRLVGLLGSPRLDRFYNTIQGELRLCLTIVDRDEDDPDDLVAEHRQLFELIAAGERDGCVERLNECMAGTELRLRRIARRWDEPQGGGA